MGQARAGGLQLAREGGLLQQLTKGVLVGEITWAIKDTIRPSARATPVTS